MKNTRRSIKMSVGSASSASSAGQRSGRRTNLTVADVYEGLGLIIVNKVESGWALLESVKDVRGRSGHRIFI